MPVILPREAEADWLDPSADDPAFLASLLVPYPAARMAAYPVATAVNAVGRDDAGLLAPLARA